MLMTDRVQGYVDRDSGRTLYLKKDPIPGFFTFAEFFETHPLLLRKPFDYTIHDGVSWEAGSAVYDEETNSLIRQGIRGYGPGPHIRPAGSGASVLMIDSMLRGSHKTSVSKDETSASKDERKMKQPNIINMSSMWITSIGNTQKLCNDGLHHPARPVGAGSICERVRAAWLVFTGKADALVWPGEQ